jgi:hypothetical protein
MIQLVLTYGHSEFARVCIESIYKNTPPEEINLVVWDNLSEDRLKETDVDQSNTVLLKLDNNYGSSNAVNYLMDVGERLGQDVMYISNDHYMFPGWSTPFLEGGTVDIASPWAPFGLHIEGDVPFWNEANKARHNRLKTKYLDHPESKAKILEFLKIIYPEGERAFLDKYILTLPTVSHEGQLWTGCFHIRKEALKKIPRYRTDMGLSGEEDYHWYNNCRKLGLTTGVYCRSYAHHFQCVTIQRMHLSMDHGNTNEVFGKVPPPAFTDEGKSIMNIGEERLKQIIK